MPTNQLADNQLAEMALYVCMYVCMYVQTDKIYQYF